MTSITTLASGDDGTGADAGNGDVSVAAVFEALDEPVCREILHAVQREALTAQELANDSGRSLSTVYRKISLLTDAGLIEEHTRIQTRGKHASQYRSAFEDICISLTGRGFEVEVA